MKPIIGVTPVLENKRYALHSAYCKAISVGGGLPVILTYADCTPSALHYVHGIVLTGGGDIHPKYLNEPLHPEANDINEERDDCELLFIKQAISRKIPMLGICRGMQLMNLAMGGGIHQHILGHLYPERKKEAVHSITIKDGSLLQEILDTADMDVNSVHHQAVSQLGEGVAATAHAQDGIIEGIELSNQPFAIGVQWHPEALYSINPKNLSLFSYLAEAANCYAENC